MSMVEQSKAVIVANPIPAGPLSDKLMDVPAERIAFMASANWSAAFHQTTLSRIWCIGEHLSCMFPLLGIQFFFYHLHFSSSSH